MNQEQQNMLIRHDEQLKAVPRLCDSVDRLTTAVQEIKVSKKSWWQVIVVLGSIISCVGTWVVLIKIAK